MSHPKHSIFAGTPVVALAEARLPERPDDEAANRSRCGRWRGRYQRRR